MRKHLMIASLLLGLTALPSQAAPRRSFRPAVVVEGMVFPVARTDYYSVINFRNDWHAPRMRNIDGRWRQVGVHEGNDIFAEPGTPVRAVTAGRVENLGWLFYSGWRVGIRAPDGRYWFYAHLRRYAPGLSIGDRVDAGDEFAEVGNTGYGTDPGHADEFTYHLHLGIQEPSGRWINPYPIVGRLYRQAVKSAR
ncbi:MAG: M23 family metallopeptidase [Actinomycetota bacterium]|jgi:murein DD-endopeptidase MepM/ murein hydrolase activator NlpD